MCKCMQIARPYEYSLLAGTQKTSTSLQATETPTNDFHFHIANI